MSKKIYLAIIGLLAVLLSVSGASAGSPVIGAPTNLECHAVDETSITCSWGPTQPGPFSVVAVASRKVTISWGVSADSQPGTITYCVQKNSNTKVCGITSHQRAISVGGQTTSFKVCVQAFNGERASPLGCTTFIKGAVQGA